MKNFISEMRSELRQDPFSFWLLVPLYLGSIVLILIVGYNLTRLGARWLGFKDWQGHFAGGIALVVLASMIYRRISSGRT